MANSVDPDQTARIGAVCSGSTLFASIVKFASYVGQLFAAVDYSRRHFQMHFFSCALRVKSGKINFGVAAFASFHAPLCCSVNEDPDQSTHSHRAGLQLY